MAFMQILNTQSVDVTVNASAIRPQGKVEVPWLLIYGGHWRKRATISGEYHGRSGVISRVMQPLKNAAQ